MGAQGTATANFGAFPGASDVEVTVTGQTGILVGSMVEAWIYPSATADHTVGEHIVETLACRAHTIVAGTGFTISVYNTSTLNEPLESGGAGQRDAPLLTSRTIGYSAQERGGVGTRIYGLWTIGWAWN